MGATIVRRKQPVGNNNHESEFMSIMLTYLAQVKNPVKRVGSSDRMSAEPARLIG